MDNSLGERINLSINLLLLVLAFSIPIYRKWVVICAPLIIVLWFIDGRLRDKLRVLRHHRLTLAILAFILLNAASLLWSSDPRTGLAYIAKYRYLLLVPVIATSLQHRFRARVRVALVTGSTISVLLSLAFALRLFRSSSVYHGNPAPTMSHLDFSMIIAVAALLIVNHLAHNPMTGHRWTAWLGLLVLHIAGLLVNIGRSGQAAFAVTLLVMVPIYLSRRSRRAAAGGILAVLVALFLAYSLVPRFHRRVKTAITEIEETVTEHRYRGSFGRRIAGAIVAADMIRSRPVLGTGVGANMNEFRSLLDTQYQQFREVVYWFPHLHNQYLQVTTELGLVGLGSMLLIFFVLIRGPYPRREEQDLAALLCCAFLVGFLGDPFLHKNLPLVLFATLSGVISAEGNSAFWKDGANASRT
jgi:O-antigen ligase